MERGLDFGIIQVGTENSNLVKFAEFLFNNPFAPYTAMNLDTLRSDEEFLAGNVVELYSESQAFDKKIFVEKLIEPILVGRRQELFNQGHSNEISFYTYISRNRENNWINIGFQLDSKPYIAEHGEQNCISEFTQMFRKALTFFPELKNASAGTMDDLSIINKEMKMGRNRPFHLTFGPNLQWINVVSPHAFHPFYKKDDILKTPAYHIEEWENDVVYIQLYENPFDLFKQENKEIYRDASAWLFQCLNREEVNKPRKAT